MEKIVTAGAPAAIGPYSQGVVAGDYLFTSGQVGLDPVTMELAPGGLEGQAEQALKNLLAVIRAAGGEPGHIVKTTCFLSDIGDFGAFNEVYARHIPSAPARSCFAVKDLPKGALIEVEAIVYLK